MTNQQSFRLSSQTLVRLSFAAAVAVAPGGGRPVRALAQLPSNRDQTAHEAFRTCARNAPATTRLTLDDTVGERVRARTERPFFTWPADTGQWIGLTQIWTGWAIITGFTSATEVTVRITDGFPSRGPYAVWGWARWPFCYMSLTGGKYGFNTGVGHQRGSTNLVLAFPDQHYAVDSCSLAHDTYYWGPRSGDPGPGGDKACNNNYWVGFCYGKIQRRTREEDVAYHWLDSSWQAQLNLPPRALRPAVLLGWQVANPCTTKRDWIELPTNPGDIPAASCYDGPGAAIYGLGGRVLDVKGAEQWNGAKIILWNHNGGCNQKWRKVRGKENPAKWGYELRGFGGKCLGTRTGVRPGPGDLVEMQDCGSRYTYTQRWQYEHGQIRVRDPRPPRLCLDVNERESPMTVIVAKCASINPKRNPSQQWRFADR
jgi:hypothetical protein